MAAFLTRTCHPEDHRVIAGRVVDTHIYSIIMDVLVGLRPRNHLERWLQCASLNGLNVLHALGIFQRVVAGRVGAGRRREDQTSERTRQPLRTCICFQLCPAYTSWIELCPVSARSSFSSNIRHREESRLSRRWKVWLRLFMVDCEIAVQVHLMGTIREELHRQRLEMNIRGSSDSADDSWSLECGEDYDESPPTRT